MDIVVSQVGQVALLELSNPPLNVVTLALTRELGAALADLECDRSVRALVVTGAGDRAFCAGSDIRELPELASPGLAVERKLRPQNQVFDRLAGFPKPTVAALNGLTLGGGLEIALCCDFLVAGSDVEVGLPEIRLGVFPSSGGPLRLQRRIGPTRAKEMIFLGERIDAATAQTWGLVNKVVPPGLARQEALALATRLSEGPRRALQLVKGLIDQSAAMSAHEAIARSLTLSDEVFSSEECREGVSAFLEKRRPRFDA